MRGEYIRRLLQKDERIDGRELDNFREIKVEKGLIERAEGSARVIFGKTEVIVGIKTEFGEPFPDTPNAGVLKTEAEFLPIASSEFEPGPPGEDATELARVVDRGIRESDSIDLEKLCIKENEKVWSVFVDIYIINHDGNLIDVSALAAISALYNAKLPRMEEDKIVRTEFAGSLPMLHKPITVTVGKIDNKLLIDPTKEEEEILDSKLSVAVTEDDMICAMQKGGDKGLTEKEIEEMISLAVKKSKELRKLM